MCSQARPDNLLVEAHKSKYSGKVQDETEVLNHPNRRTFARLPPTEGAGGLPRRCAGYNVCCVVHRFLLIAAVGLLMRPDLLLLSGLLCCVLYAMNKIEYTEVY